MSITDSEKRRVKKRNPQDATLRNINALKKRMKALEIEVDSLRAIVVRKK